MVDWLSLAVPFAYLGILVGSLATFSSLYRKRKATKSASLAPWFPPHLQRNIYLSLLHLDPDPSTSSEKKASIIPDSMLKAALLRRATEDVQRIIATRNARPALQNLLQRGSIGDELWQRFLRAEKEMDEEVKDVVEEANALSPSWGQTIFQSASEMAANAFIRKKVDELQSQGRADREWWDAEKASISSNFMRELNEDASTGASTTATKGSSRPTTSTGSVVGGDKAGTSDEDAVMVEGGGPAVGSRARKGKAKGKK